MTGSDEEFEDFLKRRTVRFRSPDDLSEPPAELDRVVLRQAREAIETPRPLRVFRGPRWAAPIALAATLVLALGIVFQAGMPPGIEPMAEVTVQNVAQRVDMAEAAAPTAAASTAPTNHPARADAASNAVVVELDSPALASRQSAPAATQDTGVVAHTPDAPASGVEAENYAASPPPVAPMEVGGAAARERHMSGITADATAGMVTVPAAKAGENPAWRKDSKTWLAEIERLRNAGDTARADAELEEYKRQHRAYAVAPDQ